ncbi:MAG: hypothetical protein ACI3ZM_04720 [Candidatus Cryptobacteroides sp.]
MTSKNTARMLLIAGAALVSCSENALEQDMSKGNVEIIATIDNEGLTRSCIDSTPYDGKTGILWTKDDCIGVFGSTTKNAMFTNTSEENAATTGFTGTLADGDKPQYAYYPYTSDNEGKVATALTGSVSATQSYSETEGLLNDDWKFGKLIATSGNKFKFGMTHLFALARVVINATGTPIVGETLESIAIKATSGSEIRRINGAFSFSAVDGTYSLTGASVDATTMVWKDTPELTSGASYTGYISLIPNIAAGDKITITVKTNKHKAVFEVPCKTSLKSGHLYDFPMTLTDLATKMNAAGYGEPTYSEIGGTTPDPEPVVTTGTFTACAFNVDGLPSLINSDGPGSSGTTKMAGIANNLGWDIIAASEDFEYDSQLVAGLSNYSHGTYRGTVDISQAFGSTADTDGLNFFWKTSTTSATGETYVRYNDAEGGLTSGANTCIKKGFRHYEVTVDAINNIVIDVYITHMNTYSGSGNTESNAYVKAVLSQLRQLRDYVLDKAKTNKRPAIIMGDTNMRYTRHDIKTNFLDVVAAYDNNAGYTVSDPWVEFHRGGVYPQWNSLSLMTRFAFAGDTENDIVCDDNQKGEVVDKIWYINVPGAEVQLKATAHQNDVDNFRKSTSNVSYSDVMVEDENGTNTSGNTKYNSNQSISYTKDVGYSDHFPVVTTFEWTKKTVAAAATVSAE